MRTINIINNLLAATIVLTMVLSVSPTAGAQSSSDSELIGVGGLGNIIIGKSTLADVVHQYGGEYEVIEHLTYSYEYSYPILGLSFYSCRADFNNEIFVIEARKPFPARTRDGIVLGKSKRGDVERLYTGSRGIQFIYDGKDRVKEIHIVEEDGLRQCDGKFGVVGE